MNAVSGHSISSLASDYTIFAWRRREEEHARSQLGSESGPIASSSKTSLALPSTHAQPKVNNAPTLHMHDPEMRLPSSIEYCNPSYYVFQVRAKQAEVESQRSGPMTKRKDSPVPSSKNKKGKIVGLEDGSSEDDSVPKFKKQFNRFHEENGVRTVIGSIGSVENGRSSLLFISSSPFSDITIQSECFSKQATDMFISLVNSPLSMAFYHPTQLQAITVMVDWSPSESGLSRLYRRFHSPAHFRRQGISVQTRLITKLRVPLRLQSRLQISPTRMTKFWRPRGYRNLRLHRYYPGRIASDA